MSTVTAPATAVVHLQGCSYEFQEIPPVDTAKPGLTAAATADGHDDSDGDIECRSVQDDSQFHAVEGEHAVN